MTPFFTRNNPLSEPPSWDSIPEIGNQLLSLLDNMAKEEEGMVDE